MGRGLGAQQGVVEPLQPVVSLDLLERGALGRILLEHPGDQPDGETTTDRIILVAVLREENRRMQRSSPGSYLGKVIALNPKDFIRVFAIPVIVPGEFHRDRCRPHTGTGASYSSPSRISGAEYASDPQLVASMVPGWNRLLNPKSVSFTVPCCGKNTTFSGFRSRCTTWSRWQYATARTIWAKWRLAVPSATPPSWRRM
ncbi:hypothetical protein EYF80_034802 [Liparis tanakae]|uniref:Uncharacterized protein n=1 Tax=Liparis tanakae TaxID=230148 RepID=A0A4Z2GPD9_9TELE|nr:hypothetical protein EYF80_034802 [Liparis tanakae]